MQFTKDDEFYLTGQTLIDLSEMMNDNFTIRMTKQAEAVMRILLNGLIEVEREEVL